jgi:hypothetical protein
MHPLPLHVEEVLEPTLEPVLEPPPLVHITDANGVKRLVREQDLVDVPPELQEPALTAHAPWLDNNLRRLRQRARRALRATCDVWRALADSGPGVRLRVCAARHCASLRRNVRLAACVVALCVFVWIVAGAVLGTVKSSPPSPEHAPLSAPNLAQLWESPTDLVTADTDAGALAHLDERLRELAASVGPCVHAKEAGVAFHAALVGSHVYTNFAVAPLETWRVPVTHPDASCRNHTLHRRYYQRVRLQGEGLVHGAVPPPSPVELHDEEAFCAQYMHTLANPVSYRCS